MPEYFETQKDRSTFAEKWNTELNKSKLQTCVSVSFQ